MAAGCGRARSPAAPRAEAPSANSTASRSARCARASLGQTPGTSRRTPQLCTAIARSRACAPPRIARACGAARVEREQAVGNVRGSWGPEPALLELGRRLPHDCSRRSRGRALSGSHASGGAGNRVGGNQRSGSRMRGLRRRGRAWRALVVALATCGAVAAMTSAAAPQGARDAWPATEPGHRSTSFSGPARAFPSRAASRSALDKSMLVELPVDMKDVLVSKPEVLDATVLNPRQVNLLAKGAGDANAFILGPDGQKLVLLEVTVARDLTPLADALARLLPGSRIKVEPSATTWCSPAASSIPSTPAAPPTSPAATPGTRTPSSTCWPSAPRSRCCSRCRSPRCSATPSAASASTCRRPCSTPTSPSPR